MGDLTTTVQTGDYRASLEALRDKLAREIDHYGNAAGDGLKLGDTPAGLASLAKQLADVLAKLDALPDAQETTKLDELSAQRAERRSTTSVSDDSA